PVDPSRLRLQLRLHDTAPLRTARQSLLECQALPINDLPVSFAVWATNTRPVAPSTPPWSNPPETCSGSGTRPRRLSVTGPQRGPGCGTRRTARRTPAAPRPTVQSRRHRLR